MLKDQTAVQDSHDAVLRVANVLQSEGPPVSLISSTIVNIIRVCSDISNIILPFESDANKYITGLAPNTPISQQTYEFHSLFDQSHALLANIFLNVQSQNV